MAAVGEQIRCRAQLACSPKRTSKRNDGPFRPDWATLNKYEQPQWYKDAKFGIFIHWGVYSVPAAENEWYPRNMYKPERRRLQELP